MTKFDGPSDMTGTFSHWSDKICVISGPDVQYGFFHLPPLNRNFWFKDGVMNQAKMQCKILVFFFVFSVADNCLVQGFC